MGKERKRKGGGGGVGYRLTISYQLKRLMRDCKNQCSDEIPVIFHFQRERERERGKKRGGGR